MEKQAVGKNFIRRIVFGVVILALMSGSCVVGSLLSSRTDELLTSVYDTFGRKKNLRTTREVAPLATRTPIPPTVFEDADAEEQLVASIYEQVSPSVVHIRVMQRVTGTDIPRVEIPGQPDSPEAPQDFYRQGAGSGFVWDTDGHIVTNYHVVQNAEEVEVAFLDGTTVLAEIIGVDPDSDLAVLKVDLPATQFHPVTPGDSDALFVWLGILGRDLDRETALAMQLSPDQRGALVIEVVENSPAEEAGLRSSDASVTIDGANVEIGGDIIVAIEGQPVYGIEDLITYLVEETRPGQEITLTVLRERGEHQIEVTLGQRPRQ